VALEAPNCGRRAESAGPVGLRERCNSKASTGFPCPGESRPACRRIAIGHCGHADTRHKSIGLRLAALISPVPFIRKAVAIAIPGRTSSSDAVEQVGWLRPCPHVRQPGWGRACHSRHDGRGRL